MSSNKITIEEGEYTVVCDGGVVKVYESYLEDDKLKKKVIFNTIRKYLEVKE
jgi:hypothetical protein